MKKKILENLGKVLLHLVGIPFATSILGVIVLFLLEVLVPIGNFALYGLATIPLFAGLCYFLMRKKMDWGFAIKLHGIALLVYSLIFLLLMVIGKGNPDGTAMVSFFGTCLQFLPATFMLSMIGTMADVALSVILYFALVMGISILGHKLSRSKVEDYEGKSIDKLPRFVAVVLAISLVTGAIDWGLYRNRPQARYAGHGFDYMNGYSSTDFSDYMVYAEPSKLVELDHKPDLWIEKEEEMPILDGAEACYPLYAALAKAVYKDIDVIEKNYEVPEEYHYMYASNGKIISFSNTINAFDRLVDTGAADVRIYKAVDIYFGAKPSADQLDYARECGVEPVITPIGREGFVFFVEEDNPVSNLTSDQIRAIYHGDITNWKELGGKDQEIVAFQRPNNSGSQTMMEYFMGDISLKEPMTYEQVDSMIGVIRNVAQYHNEAGAMGYTFRYFLEGLNQEKGVKMLSVDGVYPSVENIESGAYPIIVPLVVVTRKDDPNPNVQKMIDFILSKDGQYIVKETGYAPLE